MVYRTVVKRAGTFRPMTLGVAARGLGWVITVGGGHGPGAAVSERFAVLISTRQRAGLP
jgi:hypothetical protein